MNLVFMEYGSRWKQYRRALHQHLQKNAVYKYWPIQVRGVRLFLESLLDSPDDFSDNIKLYVPPHNWPSLVFADFRCRKGSREIMGTLYGFRIVSAADKVCPLPGCKFVPRLLTTFL